jgi:hypothetical protein
MKHAWILVIIFGGTVVFGQASTESFPPAGTMKQLMVDLVYPASNDILLSIYRGGPTNDNEWASLRRSALALAESGNLLTIPGRARDQSAWMKDVKMLVDVGTAAYKSAQAKDFKALVTVAAPLDAACLTCHKQYRPDVFHREATR